MISIRNLKKSYGSNTVIQDISVDFADGEVVSIIGPSGCGKSTFLRCINLLEQPDSGQVVIDGMELTAKGADLNKIRSKMGMVFQSFNLFSHKTVLENVILAPMKILKLSKEEAVREAMSYLEMVGLANRADHLPSQLSGGQKQRVAIARCLAMKPEVILFDEPTSALDPTMVDEVLSVIRKLVKNGLSCIIVTHEMAFAKNVSSKIVYMDDKSIYELGTPEQIFETPQREKTKIFINKLKVFSNDFKLDELDLYEVMRMVSEYCLKYDMTKHEANTINLICEEFLTYLMQKEKAGATVNISISYNEKENIKELMFQDDLPQCNHFDQEDFDEISLNLIKGMTKSSAYSCQDGRNMLSFVLK